MTYEELCLKMDQNHLQTIKDALQIAVKGEADLLLEQIKRKTEAATRRCLEDAQTFYAMDISTFLDAGGGVLQPEAVLNNRRLAIAWALAAKILDALKYNGPACQNCGASVQDMGQQHIHDYKRNVQPTVQVYRCANGHLIYISSDQVQVVG
jgi:hypothetical protein